MSERIEELKPIRIKDVKKGDIFYECEYGENLKCLALEDPRQVDGQTFLQVLVDDKDDVEFLETEAYPAYWLRTYTQPVYFRAGETE